MQTRQLGDSELRLTEVGFGAWALGGGGWAFSWGAQDDRESVAAIRRALELGINWIDTAAVYGLGHSEQVVAKALAGVPRGDVIIATKCSLVWDDNGNISDSLKAESVRRECENSLRRLDTDHIDLYQIHWPNDEERIEEGWAEIGRLIEEGKVRYGGVSNFLERHLERAHRVRPVASLQPPYSMLRRWIEDAEMRWCAEHGAGIVCYSPMQAGLLTGSFTPERVQDEDWRRQSKEHTEPNLSVNLWFVEQLRPIAEKYGNTVAQLAIAWTLRRDEVTSAIAGARRPAQIEETSGGAGFTIDHADLRRIDALLDERERRVRDAGGYVFELRR
ncbi:MAG: Aldo-keto reductase YhdN [Calditrichaeota bacterium]|nr:Aldo-keto reductase YhdN [Calditrichota bacterium]